MRTNKTLTLGILAGFTLAVFLELAWLSIARYQAYNAHAFDIGIMSQAIWSVTQGQPLVFTIEGIPLSRLARHVELIYFLFAPFYAVWPNPQTLLILQALLYITGVLPLYALAERRINSAPLAAIITMNYLFYPVAQTAVLFDFHGDTLAMPLLLFVIDASDRKAWRSYAFWLILAMLCKFYVAFLVIALGCILCVRSEYRAGLLTISGGVLWSIITFLIIRPFFAPPEASLVQATSVSYFNHYFGAFQQVIDTLLPRLVVALVVYLPALIVGWRAVIWLLAASVIALPALLSNGPGPSYHYRIHHYALPVPFLMAAIVYGAEQLRIKYFTTLKLVRIGWPWFTPLICTLLLTLLMNSLFVDTPLNLGFYRSLETAYLSTSRDRFKDQWLMEHVPPTAAVVADTTLVPHLTNRSYLYLTSHPHPPRPKTLSQLIPTTDYVVIDSLLDFVIGYPEKIVSGGIIYNRPVLSILMEHPNLTLQKTGDGLLLFAHNPDGLMQTVNTQIITTTPPLLATFGDLIGLTQATLTPLKPHRYRLKISWVPLPSLTSETLLIAVSQLADIPHNRFVHLPTWGGHPTPDWQPNEIVHEQFDLDIPTELPPGTYPLLVGWYKADTIYSHLTDEQTRIGNLIQIGQIEIP